MGWCLFKVINEVRVACATHHDLADGDHGGAEAVLHAVELAEVPAGHLEDAVVEGGLEAGRGGLGHAVADGDQVLAC